jgi:uncharacterized membrane protein YraQ (UPF0718 family)
MSDQPLLDILISFVFLFTESAPFLLIGLLLAGVIRMMVPDKWIEKTLGKNSSVTTAAIIGAPIPLCSCSVIPTAIGIRRAGASKASTASFMVATPETGVDSVGVTLALMGPVMAVIRPISAVISAIVAGILVKWWDVETPPKQDSAVKKCCGGHGKKAEPSLLEKAKLSVQYGYGKLLSDFMNWLLVGLFFAALINTFVPESFLTTYGSGIFAMVVMIVISIPMYICATASTPIAAGLMLSGVSPGAALVFMLAGPATNIATLMVVKNELGKRSLAGYLVGVIFSAVILGLAVDFFVVQFGLTITVSVGEHSDMITTAYTVSAFILALLMAVQYVKKIPDSWWPNKQTAA